MQRQIWCWGSDRSEFVTGLVTSGRACVRPGPIPTLQHARVSSVAAGHRHSLCLINTTVTNAKEQASAGSFSPPATAATQVMAWGVFGEVSVLTPAPLRWTSRLKTPIVAVACGEDRSLFLTRGGRVYCCAGSEHVGSAANGSASGGGFGRSRMRKQCVRGIACGNRFDLAWTREGELWSWGANEHGQLGRASSMMSQRANSNVKKSIVKSSGNGVEHSGRSRKENVDQTPGQHCSNPCFLIKNSSSLFAASTNKFDLLLLLLLQPRSSCEV